ncbi:MAG TPA: NAD(P)/FAD-dependent oxidoreductase [Xanthobacteraceae bacterium]|nr:NAD(P)/FAD-dependent oxidoreductase [Xanthobacteraceae bacterium]
MPRFSRRSFLAAGAAALLRPGLATGSDFYDVIVVGAGLAGIAAARRIAEGGRRVTVLEASDRIGGRCITDTATFGLPCDTGAHWLYRADIDPLVKLGRSAGLDIYDASLRQRLRIGQRFARENEVEIFYAALVKANRAFGDMTRTGRDLAASQTLPRDLGEWRATIEFALGPLYCGRSLDKVSAFDLARAAERDSPAFCRQGCGALAMKLAEGVDVKLSTPVRRIATYRGLAYVESGKGTLRARAAIVTAPLPVLAAEKIRFDPHLPKSHADALAKLGMGHYERVAVELEGNPLGLEADAFVLEKAEEARSAALLANVGGSKISFVELPGETGEALARQGPAAMQAYALDWLAKLFGSDVKRSARRGLATQWSKAPWTLGAFATASPGAAGARVTLMEPVRDRVYFAGEAVHETLWGTMAGAWESGDRAGRAVLKTMTSGSAQRRSRPQRRAPVTAEPAPQTEQRRGGFWFFFR